MRNAAIYVRVENPDEDVQPQLRALRQLARRRHLQCVGEYVDICSGKTSRPRLDSLLADGGNGKFSIVLTVSLSRLAKDIRYLLRLAEQFSASSVGLISMRDKLDTTKRGGKQFFRAMTMLRQCEADLVKENIRMGLRRRKLDGLSLGRTRLQVSCEVVARDRQSMSLTQTARKHGISRASVVRMCREAKLNQIRGFGTPYQQNSAAVRLL